MDSLLSCTLDVSPDPAAVGVVGVRVPVEITLEAPFKKALLWIVGVGVPLLVIGLGLFCWYRLTGSVDEEPVATAD
jgi:hypothetical protein